VISTEVRAGTRKKLLGVVIAVQVALPFAALLHRIMTGALATPWGWQMFS
jgi:hypothetical protein